VNFELVTRSAEVFEPGEPRSYHSEVEIRTTVDYGYAARRYGENLERQVLKNLVEPVHPQATSVTRSLYGRDGHMDRIEQLMRATAEGRRGHMAVLESGTGTGKTRLLQEAVSLAARHRFAVLDRAPDRLRQASLPKSLTLVGSRQDLVGRRAERAGHKFHEGTLWVPTTLLRPRMIPGERCEVTVGEAKESGRVPSQARIIR
jgi:hypothetical protein